MIVEPIKWKDLPASDGVPGGQYHLRIDQAKDIKEDKNGERFFGLQYTILEPAEFANKKAFENFIPMEGRSLLRKILTAIEYGQEEFSDPQSLVGYEFNAMLRTKSSEEFGEQIVVTVYIAPQDKPALTAGGKGTARKR